MAPTFEVLRDPQRGGGYRVRLTGPDGGTLADVGGLRSLDAVRATIAQIREVAAQALVVDRTAPAA